MFKEDLWLNIPCCYETDALHFETVRQLINQHNIIQPVNISTKASFSLS